MIDDKKELELIRVLSLDIINKTKQIDHYKKLLSDGDIEVSIETLHTNREKISIFCSPLITSPINVLIRQAISDKISELEHSLELATEKLAAIVHGQDGREGGIVI